MTPRPGDPDRDAPTDDSDECSECKQLGDIHCAECYIQRGKPFERDVDDEGDE